MSDLRSIRKQKGLRIEDLAAGMMRPATLSQIENGQRLPQKSTRKKIESIVGKVDWRQTISGGDRYHIIVALSEFVNEHEPGARQRILYAKKILSLLLDNATK